MTTVVRLVQLSSLFVIYLTGCMIVDHIVKVFDRRQEPPAELVATISGWPPPRDPWGPPLLSDQVHSVWWSSEMDTFTKGLPYFAPDPWTRVGA